MSIWLQIILLLVLILANGVFAASEISIVSARRGRLQQRAEAGSRGARTALQLAEEPNRFLATVQVGITLIGTLSGAFGAGVLSQPLARVLATWIAPQTAQAIAFGLAVVTITYLSLILGELVPKRIGLQQAEAIATIMAPVMLGLSRAAAPIVWFLTFSTQLVLRLLGRGNQQEEQITEEDVLSLVREGTEGGTLEASERDLIERVFDFTDVAVRSIMTPRTEIGAVAIDAPMQEVIARVIDSGYSRIPVYRGSLDTIEGIVYAKDLLRATQQPGDGDAHPLTDLLRKPVFVLEHQRIASVLQQFKQSRTHLALVLDEYGQVDGLITLEDILEELTGDIADEYDEADTMVIRRTDGSLLVDGLLSYTDAEHRIGLPPREELGDLPSFETVAGLVLALLQRIPSPGESTTLNNWYFEVVDMDGVRIDKVLIRRPEADTNRAQSEASLAIGALLPLPQNDEQAPDRSRHS